MTERKRHARTEQPRSPSRANWQVSGAIGAPDRRERVLFLLHIVRLSIAFSALTSLTAMASPLTEGEFRHLATSCAPGIQLATLRSVAAVESNFEPWAVRDNNAHQVNRPVSLSAAEAFAQDRIRRGHSVDLGLMQINSRNLAPLRMDLRAAFDPCRSLQAAGQILFAAYTADTAAAERQAATLIALSRYNTGQSLAGIVNGYVDRISAAQTERPPAKSLPDGPPNAIMPWNIWGTPEISSISWLVTSDKVEIERAGAQSINARVEERAAVPLMAKGEPYELSAYQESETSKP